jgi:hypothetical protein
MQVGPTSDFGAHIYSIHFLNILYHYTCAARAHQWGKHLGAIHRGQFCRWRASINPCFASTINCTSRWGSKHPLNSCTLCNLCKARKSCNPVARSLQPPSVRSVLNDQISRVVNNVIQLSTNPLVLKLSWFVCTTLI